MIKNIYKVHMIMEDGTFSFYWKTNVAALDEEQAKEIAMSNARSKAGVMVMQDNGGTVCFTIGRKKARIASVKQCGEVDTSDVEHHLDVPRGDILDDDRSYLRGQ